MVTPSLQKLPSTPYALQLQTLRSYKFISRVTKEAPTNEFGEFHDQGDNVEK
jgi:hypothetical protein